MSVLFEGSVPTFAIDTVNERAERVNRRADRRGFPRVTVTVGASRMVRDPYFEHACSMGYGPTAECPERVPEVEYSDVRIEATAPLRMSGWRLSGVVSADAYDANGRAVPTVADVPGESNRDIEITDAMLCEHCNTRRYRTETFILRHDDGRKMQVGRQCLRDFLGHDPASLLAGLDAFRSLMFSEDERESWGRAAPRTFRVTEVIHSAARIVAADGWYVSKQKALDSEESDHPLTSTASRVTAVLWPRDLREARRLEEEYPSNDRAQTIADNTIEALNSLNPSNEWEYKLADYRNIATVTMRHVGILASATILALRTEERAAKRAAAPASTHYGTIGQRVTLTAEVTFMREFDSAYGTKTLVKFRTEGANLMWWATSWLGELKVGDTVTITGTVKSHDADRFDGSPVTTLTRCKLG